MFAKYLSEYVDYFTELYPKYNIIIHKDGTFSYDNYFISVDMDKESQDYMIRNYSVIMDIYQGKRQWTSLLAEFFLRQQLNYIRNKYFGMLSLPYDNSLDNYDSVLINEQSKPNKIINNKPDVIDVKKPYITIIALIIGGYFINKYKSIII